MRWFKRERELMQAWRRFVGFLARRCPEYLALAGNRNVKLWILCFVSCQIQCGLKYSIEQRVCEKWTGPDAIVASMLCELLSRARQYNIVCNYNGASSCVKKPYVAACIRRWLAGAACHRPRARHVAAVPGQGMQAVVFGCVFLHLEKVYPC